MKARVLKYVDELSKALGLSDVRVVVLDLWSMGIPAWGFSCRREKTIWLHKRQLDWQDTVRHELCHLACRSAGHGKEFQEKSELFLGR